ncbi:BLUF domain-containing protein, partial [Escherichia coli]
MLTTLIYRSHIRDDEPVKKIEEMVSIANRRNMQSDVTGILLFNGSHFFQLLEWICPYISRHLLSLNPLLACCRRYSR